MAVGFMPLTTASGVPHFARLSSRGSAAAIAVAAIVLFVVFPVCNLLVPAGSVFHISDFWVTLGGKIMCYAIVALAMDLIWGYAGILSLGHGLFFALGGYAMGMYLMRSIGHDGVYHSDLPDFMVFLDWKAYPWYWSYTDRFWYAALLVVLGGVGQLAGTVYAALGLGIVNKLIEAWSGAVLAKIAVLVFIIVFIQKRPQGLFALKGRMAES